MKVDRVRAVEDVQPTPLPILLDGGDARSPSLPLASSRCRERADADLVGCFTTPDAAPTPLLAAPRRRRPNCRNVVHAVKHHGERIGSPQYLEHLSPVLRGFSPRWAPAGAHAARSVGR